MRASKKFQQGNVLAISFAHMLHDIYSSFLAPILPLLIKKLGMGLGMAGLLSAIQRLPSLLYPLVGILADRMNLRFFIIIAPSITATSMSLLGLVPHYTFLVILCFTMGVGATLFHVPGPVMIKHVSGDRIGKGMSYYMLGGELARSLGPLTILGAVSLWGLEGTFRLIPFGIFTSLLLYFKIRKIDVSKNIKNNSRKRGIKKTVVHLLPVFLLITGFTASRALMKSSLTTFLPTFLTIKGSSLWMAGISLAILQFTGAFGTLMCGTISDKIGRRKTLLIIALVSPVLMALFLVVKGIFAIPLLLLMGFFLFAPTPVMLALVQDIGSDRPAFTNSIYMTINFSIGAVTNILVGFLGDMIGLDTTYFISVLLAVLAVPCALKLKR